MGWSSSTGWNLDAWSRAAAGNQVTLNALGLEVYQANGASLDYSGVNGITVLAGTNTALIVVLQRAHATNDVTAGIALTWDTAGGSPTNQAMTLLATISAGVTTVAQIWGLRNPTVGNKTLHVAWTNVASDNFIAAIAFDHVNVGVNDATAFPHTATANSVGSISVTTTAGNMVVGSIDNQGPAATLLGNQIYRDVTNGSLHNAAGDYILATSGTATVGVSSGSANNIVGVDVQFG